MKLARSIDNYKKTGRGNPKEIAIILTSHGIGDDISSCPAIAQKISEGFNITVFCKPFQRYIFESLGCKTYPSVEGERTAYTIQYGHIPFESIGFIGNNFDGTREAFELLDRFGVIYDVPQWSIWEVENTTVFYKNRIQFFAELIETTVPNFFSWEFLKPKQLDIKPFVLFAPDSASRMRGLLNQKKFYKELKKHFNVIIFGTDILYHYDQKPKVKINAATFALKNIYGISANTVLKQWNKSVDRNKILCNTMQGFLSYIYSASVVVSADNGVMNAARALGIPTIGLFGGTPEIAASQYKDFNDSFYKVIKCEHSGAVEVEDSQIDFTIDLIKENIQWDKFIPEKMLQTIPDLGLTT